MVAFFAFLPWLLRAIGLLSAFAGLFQGQQVVSGGYAASPWSLGTICFWCVTSASSWVFSFLAQPTSWNTLKAALDKVFQWIKTKANIDPQNQTDADERIMAFLEEYLLQLLAELVKRWTPEAKAKADTLLADLQYCRLVAKAGQPSTETVSALASPK